MYNRQSRWGFWLLREQAVQFAHDLEGIADVEDVGLAAGPTAVGVEVDGAAVVDEAPADDVGLFTVAAGGETFTVAGGGPGLADLVEVGQEGEDGLAFAGLVDEGLRRTEGGLGGADEAEDQIGGFIGVDGAVGLFLGPSGAGDEEEAGVGADGLFAGFRGDIAFVGGPGGDRKSTRLNSSH